MRGTRLTIALLWCGAVSGFGFIAVALVQGAVRPDYSQLYQPISSLSIGGAGWIQMANFVISGLLMLAFSIGLRRALTGSGSTWGPVLIGIYGICLALAGVFTTDPGYGYPPGASAGRTVAPSWHGSMHDRVSVFVFIALTAACFVFARRFSMQTDGRAWSLYCLLTGFAVPAFFIAAAVAWSTGGPGGLFQRLSITSGWVWVGLLALHTLRTLQPTASDAPSRSV